jgi:glycosyltransferase involved in cell wall biosynthesis
VHVDLAVDHVVFKPLPIERREDLVLFRARAEAGRNAVPLGALALEELQRRRGERVQIVLFDDARPLDLPFPYRTLGVIEGEELAQAFNAATVGLALDLSVPSQIPGAMLACGLPVVDVATDATLATFGPDGPLALAPFDPLALCDAVERLLEDFEQRAAQVREGLAWAQSRTWRAATDQVAAALATAVERAGADLR